MKSFEEPWWMLDGWEEKIVCRRQFNNSDKAEKYFGHLVQALSERYSRHKIRYRSIAFWNDGEMEFCEDCEEDLQVFHGVLWLVDGRFEKIELLDFSLENLLDK